MSTSFWVRSRRVAAAASALAVVAVVAAAVVLALGVGVPQGWWPRTGRAFDADSAHRDPCDRIVGRAKAYCERGVANSASGSRPDMSGAAWRLGTAGAGTAALVVWLLRASGQRRR